MKLLVYKMTPQGKVAMIQLGSVICVSIGIYLIPELEKGFVMAWQVLSFPIGYYLATPALILAATVGYDNITITDYEIWTYSIALAFWVGLMFTFNAYLWAEILARFYKLLGTKNNA